MRNQYYTERERESSCLVLCRELPENHIRFMYRLKMTSGEGSVDREGGREGEREGEREGGREGGRERETSANLEKVADSGQ